MKRTVPVWVLIVAAAALLLLNLFTLFQLGNLESRLDSVNGRLQQSEEFLNDRIDSIYQEVDDRMKKETGLLALWDQPQGGQVDEASLTLPVTLSFTPKNLTDDTQAALSYHGQEFPCTREGNRFTGILPLSLWEELTCDEGSIVFTQGETTQITPFPDDWWFSPRFQALPVFQGWGQSGSWGPRGGDIGITMDYEAFVDIPQARTLSNPRWQIRVGDQLWKEGSLAGAGEDTGRSGEAAQQRFSFTVKETIPAKPGEVLSICLTAADDLGLEYRFVLQEMMLDDQGEPQDLYSAYTRIYRAKDGTLLWEE